MSGSQRRAETLRRESTMTAHNSTSSNRRRFLAILCMAVLAVMFGVTTYASLDRSILNVGSKLLSDPWFLATLCDAYCGFLFFYAWVAFKERTAVGRVVWFFLIMGLGNIAMAIYVLRELWRTRHGDGMRSLLLPREPSAS